jgi:hypothetical protein
VGPTIFGHLFYLMLRSHSTSFTLSCNSACSQVPLLHMQVTFHGVDKSGDNWSSHVQVGPARVFAGTYPSAAQAALAYNAVLEALITAGAPTVCFEVLVCLHLCWMRVCGWERANSISVARAEVLWYQELGGRHAWN